jgi:hypothetical protein
VTPPSTAPRGTKTRNERQESVAGLHSQGGTQGEMMTMAGTPGPHQAEYRRVRPEDAALHITVRFCVLVSMFLLEYLCSSWDWRWSLKHTLALMHKPLSRPLGLGPCAARRWP